MPSKPVDALWSERPEDLPLEPPEQEMTELLEQCLKENDGGMLLEVLSRMALLRQAAASAYDYEQEFPDLEPPRRAVPKLSAELMEELVQALSEAGEQIEGSTEECGLREMQRKLQWMKPGKE